MEGEGEGEKNNYPLNMQCISPIPPAQAEPLGNATAPHDPVPSCHLIIYLPHWLPPTHLKAKQMRLLWLPDPNLEGRKLQVWRR